MYNLNYSGSRSLVKLEKLETVIASKEKEKTNSLFYPNSMEGLLFLENQTDHQGQIYIYGLDGEKQKHWHMVDQGTLDISGLSSGLYFIEVRHGNARTLQKVVKL